MQILLPAVVFHGVLAVVIILVVLAIIGSGIFSLLRLSARGARKAAGAVSHHDDERRR